ncbi:MAG: twin-arginine translocase TatA/TatE family subunit [Pseudomonadota bacterium]
MGLSFWQIAVVAILVVLLFGRGKISDLMGDVAKGIKSFKKGMKDDEDDTSKTIDHEAASVNSSEAEKTRAS